MTKIQVPGLIDVHVHLRDPGAPHKEDWDSGTAAGLAGGFTLLLAMPNTQPPITSKIAFEQSIAAATEKARCDYGLYYGAGPENNKEIAEHATQSAGLKMYLDSTYGELRLDDMTLWMKHFEDWPKDMPLAVHAEGRTLAAAILMSELYNRPVHLCHISRREEILVIKEAKQRGLQITCEVGPHHLFLTEDDIPNIGPGRSEVRPVLNTKEDQAALWEHIDIIDCIATDHAPHMLEEKDSKNPPPGFPGLETALPLMLNAVEEKRLSMEDLIDKMYTNPQRIFNLPEQAETYTEIDLDAKWEIKAENCYTRCGWTPFEGWNVMGKVTQVVLRGQTVYEDGEVLAAPGNGKNVRMQ